MPWLVSKAQLLSSLLLFHSLVFLSLELNKTQKLSHVRKKRKLTAFCIWLSTAPETRSMNVNQILNSYIISIISSITLLCWDQVGIPDFLILCKSIIFYQLISFIIPAREVRVFLNTGNVLHSLFQLFRVICDHFKSK